MGQCNSACSELIDPCSQSRSGYQNEGDWTTPVQRNLDFLARFVPYPGKVITTSGVPTAISPGNNQSGYATTSPAVKANTPGATAPETTTLTTSPVTTTATAKNTAPMTSSLPSSDHPSPVLEVYSWNGGLYVNQARFHLKGICWKGFETAQRCCVGLGSQSMESLLHFCANNSFNAIRITLCAEICLNLGDKTNMPSGIDFARNPNLKGLTCGQVLDYLVQACANIGIWVLPAMYTLTIQNGHDESLWYNDVISEAQLIQAWTNLVLRFKNCWNIVGCDIFPDLHDAASWGDGNLQTDARLAATRIGNAILNLNPRLPIWVTGTQGHSYPAQQKGVDDSAGDRWWGGDLSSCRLAPVTLSCPNKLVYSPHVFGPDVASQSYQGAADYPANMPAVWTKEWAHIVIQQPLLGPACVIGEWGFGIPSRFKDHDHLRTFQSQLVDFLIQNEATDTFFCNLETGDWGILQANCVDGVDVKLQILTRLCSSPGKITCINGKPAACFPGAGQLPFTCNGPNNPVASTWFDSSVDSNLTQINYTLTNKGSTLQMCTLGLDKLEVCTQIWNVASTGQVSNGLTIFSLPSWDLKNKGIVAGGSTAFGCIYKVKSGTPTWTILQ